MDFDDSNRKTELSLERVSDVADCMPGGFFIYRADESEEILFINKIALDIFGCADMTEFTALTGNSFRGMVYGKELEDVEEAIQKQVEADDKKFDHVEYRIRRKDGEIRWVDDFGRLVNTAEYGEVYFVFVQDVTEKKKIQEENLHMALMLEKEHQVREMRDGFLFNVSHDLRTPMNAIIGFTDLAIENLDNTVEARDYLTKVQEANRQMMVLIDDLLDMNQLENGENYIHYESCDLHELTKAVLDVTRTGAQKKGIGLISNIDIPQNRVLVDSGHLRRILGNLLENSIKYTKKGGSVTFTATTGSSSDSGYTRYEFVISDTGIGMSKEFLSRLFLPFEREDSSTRSGAPGVGLGLPIAKRIADMMGGTITVDSEKGKGSVFTVSLPLKNADMPDKLKEEPVIGHQKESAISGRRILLVEDMHINRMLAERVLTKGGFLVESVCDGCDAVEIVREKPEGYYDLILMDIQMPVMNGYEATKLIRAEGRMDLKSIPIVALSANARPADVRQSLECGMNAHIAKPFDAKELVNTINEFIDLSSHQ